MLVRKDWRFRKNCCSILFLCVEGPEKMCVWLMKFLSNVEKGQKKKLAHIVTPLFFRAHLSL
jgi:hypothetical protein